VRALVLDGVVDPSAASEVTTSPTQVDAVDDAVEAIDAACAEDPSCPVTDAGGVLAAYDELARRIESDEVSGHGVGPTQLGYAAFSATYGQDRWPTFWTALSDGLGGDLRGIGQLADWFTGLVEYTPFALVTCLDGTHPVGYDAWQAEADRAARRSPRFGRLLANELLPCAWWPQGSFRPHDVEAPGTPPVLVVGSTGDAATPFEQAERAARTLADGVLLTVEQAGHIALGDSDCADAVIERYLVELVEPAPGTRC
jgi:pimeloyl-ACP methyl ester carboxylesterase